jgi:hypothetical protein
MATTFYHGNLRFCEAVTVRIFFREAAAPPS